MLKPIKPKRYITGGRGLDFARRITERSAARDLYEPTYGELVFAVGAAGEREDLSSVLELLENVLDALKNGIGTRGGRLSLYVRGTLSLVRNILSVGGYSPEYNAVAAIYNEICERLSGGVLPEKAADGLDDLREKLRENIRLVRSAASAQKGAFPVREYASLRKLNAASARQDALFVREYAERRALPAARALGASGGWVLRMAGRDPELLKTVKSNRVFTELALRCEEMLRRGAELRRGFSVLITNLNERQREFIGRFIRERGLFSSVMTERDGAGEAANVSEWSVDELRYLAERSSERELSGFFRELYREVYRDFYQDFQGSAEVNSLYESGTAMSVFSSERDMREFFKAADKDSVERLCERLSERSRGEVNVLREAEREYERVSGGTEELVKRAFGVLERQVSGEEFSWEMFRERMRSSEVFGEYALPDVRNVTEEIYGAESGLVLSFAEFAVNRVRELREIRGGAAPSGVSIETAENLERILYYGKSEIDEKCAEIRRLISVAEGREATELSRLYAEFTGVGSADGILREMRAAFESVKREDRLEAVRELLSVTGAAGIESSEARAISAEIADFKAKNGDGSFLEVLERSGGYSKLEALVSANNSTEYERFSERVGEWFSEYDGRTLTKTLERLRAFSERKGFLLEFEKALSEKENSSRDEVFAESFSEFERTAGGLLTVLELYGNHDGELSEALVKTAETLERIRRSESGEMRRETALELAETLSERSFSESSEGRYFSELKAICEELSEISNEELFSSERFSKLENRFRELEERARLEYSEAPNTANNLVRNEIRALRQELEELKTSVSSGRAGAADSGRFLEKISRLSESFKGTETVSGMRDLYVSRLSELNERLSERSFSESSEGRYFSELKAIAEELSEISNEELFSSERFSEIENRFQELAERARLEYSEAPNTANNIVRNEIRALRQELEELKTSVLSGTAGAADSGRFLEKISRLSESFKGTETVSGMRDLYVSRLSELNERLSERTERIAEGRSRVEISDTSVRERFTRALFGAVSDSAAARSVGETLGVLQLVYTYTGGEGASAFLPHWRADLSVNAGRRVSDGISEWRLVYGVSERSEGSAFSREVLRERDIERLLPEMGYIALRRAAVERQTTRAGRELLIRLTRAANSPSERIFRQTSEQTERLDYSAAELFYTEEYFDSSRGAVTVSYAVQPKGFSDSSDEAARRISGLKSKLDDVSRQLESVRSSEEEMTKRFMLKSERAVLEKEIKSSIEQDITLAGKRHGVY